MKHLTPLHPDKFTGCEMIVPETVFYLKGKAQMLMKIDKNFCLTAVGSAAVTKKNFDLSNENIYKILSIAVRERKLDKNGLFAQLYIK